MPSPDTGISHVSDTALMVAACRAMETASPDGLVRDPFAEKLAGPRGMAIAQNIHGPEVLQFGVGIRTLFLDEMIPAAIAEANIATVLCVGSGLDTRPWRLDLPAGLRWIEVDFPEMLDYKTGIMAEHQPQCRRETIPADITDAGARRALFEAVGSAPALMITEGLLTYLPAETVEALASDSAALSGIRHWLLNLETEEMSRRVGMDQRTSILNMRAETHLHGQEMIDVLNRQGWNSVRRRTFTRDAWMAAQARILALMAKRAVSSPRDAAAHGRSERRAPVRESLKD